MLIEVPLFTMTQCDAIRYMTGNVTSSRMFLGAKCANNHLHKRDCFKLEIFVCLYQTSVTLRKEASPLQLRSFYRINVINNYEPSRSGWWQRPRHALLRCSVPLSS
jgi:hypothetical protein